MAVPRVGFEVVDGGLVADGLGACGLVPGSGSRGCSRRSRRRGRDGRGREPAPRVAWPGGTLPPPAFQEKATLPPEGTLRPSAPKVA